MLWSAGELIQLALLLIPFIVLELLLSPFKVLSLFIYLVLHVATGLPRRPALPAIRPPTASAVYPELVVDRCDVRVLT